MQIEKNGMKRENRKPGNEATKKNRAELLQLFLTNPDRSLYMQEIGRVLGKKPGYFQRTINNLVSEGILESEYKANARYFRVNKNYPLYKELKSVVSSN